jgi:flagellar biogenesis protein FliO
MRIAAAAAFILAQGLAMGTVRAVDPSVNFAADVEHIEITIPGVRTTQNKMTAVGDHLELAIEGKFNSNTPILDPTVRRIETTDGYLGITLSHGRRTTQKIANAARIENTATGLRVSLPRKDTLGTWLPNAVKSIAPVAAVAPIEIPAPTQRREAPVATVSTEEVAVPAAMPGKPAPSKGTGLQTLPPANSNLPVVFSVVLVAGLAAFVAMKNRKKGNRADLTTLDLVTHRSLGGKNRIVLLKVKGRELLIGVSDNRMNLLDAWPAELESEETVALVEPSDEPVVPKKSLLSPSSPLVSGILKLKNRRTDSTNIEHASGDAEQDREWERALAEATESGPSTITGGRHFV